MVVQGVAVIRHGFLFGAVVALLAACQTPETDVSGIRLGMTKEQLVATVGEPDDIRDSSPNELGEMEDIWEYNLAPDATTGRDVATEVLTTGFGSFKDPTAEARHVFHFVDGRLVSWGLEDSQRPPD